METIVPNVTMSYWICGVVFYINLIIIEVLREFNRLPSNYFTLWLDPEVALIDRLLSATSVIACIFFFPVTIVCGVITLMAISLYLK